jgi:hypothetical protein
MTTTPTASPELPGLDNLETQARAADQDGQHIYTNPRDSDNWRANEIWHYLASPAAVLALIALARRAQPEGEAPQAEPVARVIAGEWGKKVAFLANGKDAPKVGTLLYTESGKETAQLSIGFANNDQGVHVSVMQQHAGGPVTLLHQSKVPAGDSFARFAVAAQQTAVPHELKSNSFVAQNHEEMAIKTQQAAAPGALYSYMGESGRYELLGHAVGAGKCKLVEPLAIYRDTATDNLYFRDPADFAERMVAIEENTPEFGGIKTTAPGTPEAPTTLMQALTTGIPLQEPVHITKALRAQREVRVSLAGGTGPGAAAFLVNIQMTPWTHTKETAEAFAYGYNRALKEYRAALLDVAAQLDGSQEGSGS